MSTEVSQCPTLLRCPACGQRMDQGWAEDYIQDDGARNQWVECPKCGKRGPTSKLDITACENWNYMPRTYQKTIEEK